MRRRTKVTASAAIGFTAATLAACAGLPDTSFGNGGLKLLPPAVGPATVVALPSGQIMAAMSGYDPTSLSSPSKRYVFRLSGSGSLDRSYASQGVLTLAGDGQLALGPDGRAVLLSGNRVSAYTPSGKLDTAFSGGTITISGRVSGPAVSAGKELYVSVCPHATDNLSCRLERYSATGHRDPTFNYPWINTELGGSVAAFGANGSVFLASFLDTRAGPTEYTLSRVTHSGTLDVSFGRAGRISLPPFVAASSVAVDAGGNVVMQASGLQGPADLTRLPLVFRFTARGLADRTFGWLGMTSMPGHFDVNVNMPSGQVTIDHAGRILATNESPYPPGPVHVYRYLPNGQLDPQFGVRGMVTLTSVKGVQLWGQIPNLVSDNANRPIFGIATVGMKTAPTAVIRLNG